MDNEFDFDTDDLEFEDFAPEPEITEDLADGPLDESDEFDIGDISIRTAILQKNDMLALLCIKTANKGGAICRVDPREPNPSVQLYDDPDKAIEWFTKSLRTSRKNGWAVVYDGLPLNG